MNANLDLSRQGDTAGNREETRFARPYRRRGAVSMLGIGGSNGRERCMSPDPVLPDPFAGHWDRVF